MMLRTLRWLRATDIKTECDICGVRFDLVRGGACARCRRALCFRHLHGSWVRSLMVDLGATPICVECRRAA